MISKRFLQIGFCPNDVDFKCIWTPNFIGGGIEGTQSVLIVLRVFIGEKIIYNLRQKIIVVSGYFQIQVYVRSTHALRTIFLFLALASKHLLRKRRNQINEEAFDFSHF